MLAFAKSLDRCHFRRSDHDRCPTLRGGIGQTIPAIGLRFVPVLFSPSTRRRGVETPTVIGSLDGCSGQASVRNNGSTSSKYFRDFAGNHPPTESHLLASNQIGRASCRERV